MKLFLETKKLKESQEGSEELWNRLWDIIESSRDWGLSVDEILSTVEDLVVEVREWVKNYHEDHADDDWDEED